MSSSGTPVRARKPLLFCAAAIVAALAICIVWKPVSYSEQLIRVQAEQELAHIDKAIMNEPLEVQAVLLDYAADKELVLKAWIALSKYPEKAREILSQYGSEPEFKEILKKYDESVIPVIQYFREKNVLSVVAMDATARTIQSAREFAKTIWNRMAGNGPANSNPAAQTQARELGPNERGWYAVNFIKSEGHDFLAQFVVNNDKEVKWNQTDRILKAITSFFTGGIRTLETKHDLGEAITTSDVFWAGLDVAVVAVPVKLLGAGKAVARSGEELSLATRTRLFAPRLLSKGKIFRKLGKYGAVAATVYIIVTHPSLINSVLAELAKLMGLSPWLVLFVGWFLIIALVLYPFSWLLKGLARFILFGLSWLEPPRKKSIQKIARATPGSVAA
jgi:hypothetical protein